MVIFTVHAVYGKSTLKLQRRVIAKFLIIQIREKASQFSNPLYLPSGEKKRGVSGHNKNPIIIRYFHIIFLNYYSA